MRSCNQLAVLVGAPLLCCLLAACQPPPQSRLDEEKDRHFVAAMHRLHAMDETGAIEHFQKAIEVNPHSASAHLQLGLLYEKRNEECATAIYHFEKYLKLRPNDDRGDFVRQRIMGCKMELAKSVSLGPVSGELQGQLNALARDNQQLKEENQRLGEENIRLQTYFASLNRPLPGGTPSTSIGGSPGQASRAPGSPVALPGPTSAPGAAATHKIQSGDTFYSIASRYGISVAALERANPGVDSRRLRIGQSLNLPSR